MAFPDYFARVPGITLRDPLAELLGAADGGLIDYTFADAVKLAGHACPTVAGAWLMTVSALRALYGEAMPERGRIRVELAETQDNGVAGVIASIATLLTGTAGDGGFKGLGGRFSRRQLLHFGVAGVAGLRFTRLDTNAAVDCVLRLDSIPADPRLGKLLPSVVTASASPEESRLFRSLWQQRVEAILLDPVATSVELRPVQG